MADETAPIPAPMRVNQSIEKTADQYPPDVYDLLTFQRSNWQSTSDPFSNDFIPLTDVALSSTRDVKIFVIGVLPPSANVTGRLLDRSATVAAVQGFAEAIDVSGGTSGGGAGGPVTVGKIITAPGYQIKGGEGKNTLGVAPAPGAVGPDKGTAVVSKHTPTELYSLFHDAYVAVYGKEPTPNEVLFITAQSYRESSGVWPNNNPGFIGNYGTPPAGQPTFLWNDGAYYNSYATPLDGAKSMVATVYSTPGAKEAAANGDLLGYLTSLSSKPYFTASVEDYYSGGKKGPTGGTYPLLLKQVGGAVAAAGGPTWNIDIPAHTPGGCAFNESAEDYRKRTGWSGSGTPPSWVADKGIKPGGPGWYQSTQRMSDYSYYNDACPLGTTETAADPNAKATNWSKDGSGNAVKASKDADKAADKNLNESELGQKLQGAQRAYIKALQISLEQMARTPPLKLLVNPVSFHPTEEKVIADGTFGRNGPIVEHWGEAQMKISASGRLAGFYSLETGANPAGSAGNGPGLTRTARNFSESYQNFLSMYLLYRNNAGIWLENTFAGEKYPKANNLAMVGSIYIYYDNVLYLGSFDSFNVNESDDKPFSLEYDFAFTVRAKFELDQIPDIREQYGNSDLFLKQFPDVAKKSIPTTTEKEVDYDPVKEVEIPLPPPQPGNEFAPGGLTLSPLTSPDMLTVPPLGANPALKK